MVNKKENTEFDIVKLKGEQSAKGLVYVGVIFVTLVLIAALSLIIVRSIEVAFNNEIGFDCSLENISYEDVRPAKCFGNFSDMHCPMPNTIKCKGNLVNIPMSVVR